MSQLRKLRYIKEVLVNAVDSDKETCRFLFTISKPLKYWHINYTDKMTILFSSLDYNEGITN
jgi:hypothetical protein